jgi:DNA-binding IclR family transcriptional regulator
MTLMKKVLSGTVKWGTTDALARELDMNRSTLMAMIDFLASAGYLEITGL